jgi:phage repressor protein C with HTH and peptisase S24 domain
MLLAETVGAARGTKILMSRDRELQSASRPVIADRVRVAREGLGISQPELAARVGMSQQGIAAIESGASRYPRKLRELARALGKSEAWLLGEAEDKAVPVEPNTSTPPRYQKFPADGLPVYGQAEGGADGRFILNGQRIGTTFTPPILSGVEGAYAVYVYGESMSPKFEPGELVWLHPYLPVRKNDYVVVQVYGRSEADPLRGFVKQFIRRNDKELVLRQLNPPDGESDEIRLPSEKVFSVHKVVFSQLT